MNKRFSDPSSRILLSDNRKSKMRTKSGPADENRAGLVAIAIGVAFAMCGAVAQGRAGQRSTVSVSSLQGGPWYEVIDGLRDGLRKLGFEEGKQFVLDNPRYEGRYQGGRGGGEESRTRESRPDLYATAILRNHTSQAGDGRHPHRILCRRPTRLILGSWTASQNRGEGSRACFYRDTDLTAKRLEILKEMVPKLRRVVTFYDPRGPVGSRGRQVGAGSRATSGDRAFRTAFRFR